MSAHRSGQSRDAPTLRATHPIQWVGRGLWRCLLVILQSIQAGTSVSEALTTYADEARQCNEISSCSDRPANVANMSEKKTSCDAADRHAPTDPSRSSAPFLLSGGR